MFQARPQPKRSASTLRGRSQATTLTRMARTVSCALATTTKEEVSKEPSTNSKILGRGVASVVVARIESARNLFPFSVGETSPLRALTHSGLAVLGMRPDRIAKGDE